MTEQIWLFEMKQHSSRIPLEEEERKKEEEEEVEKEETERIHRSRDPSS